MRGRRAAPLASSRAQDPTRLISASSSDQEAEQVAELRADEATIAALAIASAPCLDRSDTTRNNWRRRGDDD